jgi:MinD-like ATPase involved in chromosome partitioning or flagellar assembly
VSIAFITAILSHEDEDRIIAMLTEQGYVLKFRAFSTEDLEAHLLNIDLEQRTLVVNSEDFALSNIAKNFRHKLNIKFITLSSKIMNSEELLLRTVQDELRKSDETDRSRSTFLKQAQWITVTGSSGSPGITTIALNVASEVALYRENLLIDADIRHQDLHVRIGARREGKTILAPSFTFAGIVSSEDRGVFDMNKKECCIFDIGEMPIIYDNLLTDRRVETRTALEIILQSSSIIYVAQPSSRSLTELEKFLEFAKRELCDVQLVLILNKMSNTNRQKSFYKSFKNRISDYPSFVAPRDHSLVERAEGSFAVLSEVGARSSLRKSIQELSIYLNNSM